MPQAVILQTCCKWRICVEHCDPAGIYGLTDEKRSPENSPGGDKAQEYLKRMHDALVTLLVLDRKDGGYAPLSAQALVVLTHVAANPARTASWHAQRLGIPRPTLSHILQTLGGRRRSGERGYGLVEEREHPTNRAKKIYLIQNSAYFDEVVRFLSGDLVANSHLRTYSDAEVARLVEQNEAEEARHTEQSRKLAPPPKRVTKVASSTARGRGKR